MSGNIPRMKPIRGKASERSVLRRYLIGSAVWAVLFLVMPTELKPVWYSLFGWTSVVVAGIRVRKLPANIRKPASLIIVAGALALAGGIVRFVDSEIRGIDYPFPSFADAFSFVSVGLFLVAILSIVKTRVERITLDPLLDAIIGGVAVALLQWTLVLLPYLQSSTAPLAHKLTNCVYAALSLLLVVAALLALVSGAQRSVSNRLLAAGLVATFALDLVATLVTAGRLGTEARLYVAPLAFIFAVAGLLHPSVVLLTSRPSDPTLLRRLTNRRISILALALLTPPVLILVELLAGKTSGLALPALAALALAPLVVTRLGRLVRQNELLAETEESLRHVGERLVGAETTQDIIHVITVGAEQVLGKNFLSADLRTEFTLDSTSPQQLSAAASFFLDDASELADGQHGLPSAGQLQAHPGPDGSIINVGAVRIRPDLRAAFLVRSKHALSDVEHNAVLALCRESAIAFRSVDLTEQQVLQRSEERFGALIDNSSDIVLVLQEDLSCSYISPVAARLLGYPAISFKEFDLLALVHRDDRTAALSLIKHAKQGSSETSEVRLRHFAGTYAWFEIGGTDLSDDPSINGLVLNAREIGDRKMAEERLLHSEARFKALVQNSTDLVIVLDPCGSIRYASPSVEAAVELPAEQIHGRQMGDVFAESTLPIEALLDPSQPVHGWNSAAIEFGFRSLTGDWRVLETTLTDLRDEPAVGGLVLNARDITDRKHMDDLLLHQANHDELTGLPNRRRLLDLLTQTLQRNSGTTTVSALLIDIDNFKEINDSLGHAFGDRLLLAIAARLTGLLDPGDAAARIGGDEFVVAFERAHGEKPTTDLCEHILTTLSAPFIIEGRELSVTASAGLAFDHDRSNSAELLLQNADTAMYKAKGLGKRQVVVFESFMHTATFDRLELRADLARAVAQEQFEAFYQPIVQLETRKIVGAEALVRWRHPERGLVGPGLFIPLAEESGLIAPIGEFMLNTACTDLGAWRHEFGQLVEDFTISVNLSVQQLHDRRIVGKVSDILERTGLPAERLVLEVTESTLITDTEMIASTMQQLRSFGTRLAIDDFGTGYSSLGYIQQFEFDVLKIDKTFVDDLDSFTNQRIVTAVLQLAEQLGVKTIAEGIEEELQGELLKALGCKLGQGYLYAKPMPANEFRELLQTNWAEQGQTPEAQEQFS
ncbi:MAG: EAL domain-containing protein [Actinobacteria bacterium]|uniref:Unannotated protein n=1 Tax=freshwater metagenome TaxID=449393 RepID=A0A6J6NJK8_9ZZZZ|nr:EAL domain-containing protein [Actinomycetota bacterium]MTA73550.1 EAL domain-containing protein [Actinomycetota bacterium]